MHGAVEVEDPWDSPEPLLNKKTNQKSKPTKIIDLTGKTLFSQRLSNGRPFALPLPFSSFFSPGRLSPNHIPPLLRQELPHQPSSLPGCPGRSPLLLLRLLGVLLLNG